MRSVGLLNCYWPSPSGLVEITDQGFCSLRNMYVFKSGTSSSARVGDRLSV
jgi:hypothetical protein